jgi:hypothetical protein
MKTRDPAPPCVRYVLAKGHIAVHQWSLYGRNSLVPGSCLPRSLTSHLHLARELHRRGFCGLKGP